MEGKIVIFNGETYIRSPKSKYYFKYTTRNEERKGTRQLHRAVWEYYNGEIPPGYQVHHVDGDIDNNDISNLECLPTREHLSRHAKENGKKPEIRAKQLESIKKACEASKKWHASEEGREWHREHAAESIGKVRENRIDKQCEYCGKTFAAMPWSIYCSQSCREKARRRRLGLIYKPEEKPCEYCGKLFMPKHKRARFCSEKCKNKRYWQDEKNKCT